MPQRDYVKAGRPQPRPAEKTNAKKPMPWVLIAVVVVLLLVFAGLFVAYLASTMALSNLLLRQQPAERRQQTKVEELPPKPAKEPYTYITELENKEIQVEKQELVAKAPVSVYCGAFAQKERADELKAKIAFHGIAAEIKNSSGKFRVILGPYTSKRVAQNDKNKLLRAKVADCYVP
ncbi:MAG: SPOR domain-containing protein [Rheinheimera sp.]|nr:SPOR domain-containing protein [Rheinheimera sp.]